ncbi:MAG TPA: hypothetical protein VN969_24390 [Streptosporangiaceae bacterium]|nr:hypothetical protein [Streptosporangiaceae bacterium]
MVPPQAAAIELTAQYLVLMAQHEQLGVLGQTARDRVSERDTISPAPAPVP